MEYVGSVDFNMDRSHGLYRAVKQVFHGVRSRPA